MIGALEPLIPILLAALLTLGFWGTGSFLLRRTFNDSLQDEPGLLKQVAAIALGMGVYGTTLFVAGNLAAVYTRGFAYALLLAGVGLAIHSLRLGGVAYSAPAWPKDRYAWAVGALALYTLGGWLSCLVGFIPGSDVVGHHYAHVVDLIHLGKFGHQPRLPNGEDHISTYNPALMRMLYLQGTLLLDERVANLLHWLTQALVFPLLYALASRLAGAKEGWVAIAVYLGMGVHANFGIDVQDYTFVSVALLCSLVPILGRKASSKDLALAGAFTGIMLGTKYYGLILCAVPVYVFLDQPTSFPKRRGLAIAGGVATAVFAPWLLYNLFAFHNPLYPYFSGILSMELFKAEYPLSIIGPFISPTDQGTAWPRLWYYASLFIPFHSDTAIFNLGPLFLLTLVAGLWKAAWSREFRKSAPGALAIAAAGSLGLLIVGAGWTAFFKWCVFPGVLLSVVFGATLSSSSARWAKLAAWAAVFVAFGNLGALVWTQRESNLPEFAREKRATAFVSDLNTRLTPGDVVAGVDPLTHLYLRRDVLSLIQSGELRSDFEAERVLLEKRQARYLIRNPKAHEMSLRVYGRVLGWVERFYGKDARQYGVICSSLKRDEENDLAEERFLSSQSRLVKVFEDGRGIYELLR